MDDAVIVTNKTSLSKASKHELCKECKKISTEDLAKSEGNRSESVLQAKESPEVQLDNS